MAFFQPFKKASAGATPKFLEAEIALGRHKALEQAKQNSRNSQNIIGAGQIYNAGMGDRSPIADYMFGPEEVPTTVSTEGVITPTGSDTANALRDSGNVLTEATPVSGVGLESSVMDLGGASEAGAGAEALIPEIGGMPVGVEGLGAEAIAAESAGVAGTEALATEAIAAELAGTAAATGGGAAAGGGMASALSSAGPYGMAIAAILAALA